MKHSIAIAFAVILLGTGCKKDDKAPAGGSATTGSGMAGSSMAGSDMAGSGMAGSGMAGSAAAGSGLAGAFPAPLMAATDKMIATVEGIIAALSGAADCAAKAKVLTDSTTTLKPVADGFQAEYEKLEPTASDEFDATVGAKMVNAFSGMGPHLEKCAGDPAVTAAATEFAKIGQE
jgi:hypothetical protein